MKNKNENLNLVRIKTSKALYISTKIEGSYVLSPIDGDKMIHLEEKDYEQFVSPVKGKIKFS